MWLQLISAFVFTTQIVQFLYFRNPEFQASSHFLRLYSPVCVRPGQKPGRPVFSQRGSYVLGMAISENILDAIYKSRKVIVVLSQNFMKSMWGQFELSQALNRAVIQVVMSL